MNGVQLLNKATCMSLLGISESTFFRMCRDGRLPSVKIGKRWYVPASQLEAMYGCVAHAER